MDGMSTRSRTFPLLPTRTRVPKMFRCHFRGESSVTDVVLRFYPGLREKEGQFCFWFSNAFVEETWKLSAKNLPAGVVRWYLWFLYGQKTGNPVSEARVSYTALCLRVMWGTGWWIPSESPCPKAVSRIIVSSIIIHKSHWRFPLATRNSSDFYPVVRKYRGFSSQSPQTAFSCGGPVIKWILKERDSIF